MCAVLLGWGAQEPPHHRARAEPGWGAQSRVSPPRAASAPSPRAAGGEGGEERRRGGSARTTGDPRPVAEGGSVPSASGARRGSAAFPGEQRATALSPSLLYPDL